MGLLSAGGCGKGCLRAPGGRLGEWWWVGAQLVPPQGDTGAHSCSELPRPLRAPGTAQRWSSVPSHPLSPTHRRRGTPPAKMADALSRQELGDQPATDGDIRSRGWVTDPCLPGALNTKHWSRLALSEKEEGTPQALTHCPICRQSKPSLAEGFLD